MLHLCHDWRILEQINQSKSDVGQIVHIEKVWLALQTMTRPLTTEQSVEDQQILLFLNKIIFLFDDCELHREHANIH